MTTMVATLNSPRECDLRGRDTRRYQLPMQNQTNGMCECGCGQPAPIAKRSYKATGARKGEPQRFIVGHHTRLLPRPTGEASPSWKGGRTELGGRSMVFVGRDHPMAYRNGYVFEHRLIMAAVVGRFLTPDEHVHHIDQDPTNNAPDNLRILNRAQHTKLHRLIDRGVSPQDALAEVLLP